MKLQYLYCKEQLEETRRLLKESEDEKARMTAEARKAFFEEKTARFNEIWEEYILQEVFLCEQAAKIFQQLIHETEGIAHDYGLDLTAEWNEDSGMIILAFDLMRKYRQPASSAARPSDRKMLLLFPSSGQPL